MLNTPRNYYELLGVSPCADLAQIRIAYVRLMKRHHPDAAHARGHTADSELVGLINRSYATLRDPAKRAAYDSTLAVGSGNVPAAPHGDRAEAVFRRSRVLKGRRTAAALGLGVAILMILTSTSDLLREQFGISSRRAAVVGVAPPNAYSAADVRRQVRGAIAASPDEAVAVSRRCFAAAGAVRPELCVIYDTAFAVWYVPERRGPMPLYFDERIVRLRHLDALDGPGAEARLSRVRDDTFVAVLAEVKAVQPPVLTDEEQAAVRILRGAIAPQQVDDGVGSPTMAQTKP